MCSLHFLETNFWENVASGHRLLKESAVPSIFPFRKTKPPRKPPRQRMFPAIPASKKKCNELHLPADSQSSMELANAPDENQPPLQEVVADQNVSPQHGSASQEFRKIIAALETQLAITKDRESKQQAELAEQAVQLSKARAELATSQAELGTARNKLRSQSQDLDILRTELFTSQRCVEKLKTQYAPFGIEKFQECDEDIQFYTGLPDYDSFVDLLEYLDPGENGSNIIRHHRTSSYRYEAYRGRPQKVSVPNQLFMVLIKLRLGIFHQHLGHLFSVSASTVSRIFSTWVDFMYLQLTALTIWLSRQAIDEAMPLAFVEKYQSTRVLLDATEIRCEVPSSFVTQSGLYSHYKSTHTLKGLIGVSQDGLITFVSELFTGSTSDRECVRRSGFLDLYFDIGETVMADKGFRIDDLVEEIGVELNIPPFLRRDQFTIEQTQETQEIAALRIHVERRIQRIKCFHLFDRPIPISLAPMANQMWTICAILSNFQSPIIHDTEAG